MTILNKVLENKKIWPPPIWMMRQAGRYLPEYNKIRTQAGGFINLCYNPSLSSQVTLQPIDRFDFDAAIIFADILLILENMNFTLTFKNNSGPIIKECLLESTQGSSINKIINVQNSKLMNIMEAIYLTRKKLDKDKSLIGFCGGPWTVLTYLVSGKSTKDFDTIIKWLHRNESMANEYINTITSLSIDYLCLQIESGADVVKIFDSWAGVLGEKDFRKWVIKPTKKIVESIKDKFPKIPIIGFPKNASELYFEYIKDTGVDIIALDPDIDRDYCRQTLQREAVLQGNISPELLRLGGKKMYNDIYLNLEKFRDETFIMGLGHGIIKDTPIEHVKEFVKIVRNTK
tara:strand:- start:23275 stop:24309 length:1035 start_codon:yes stop_codon:yes gene_type:complete